MIEWRDENGRLHVFVDDPLTFHGPEPLPPHDFKAMLYVGRDESIPPRCWCGGPEEAEIHHAEAPR